MLFRSDCLGDRETAWMRERLSGRERDCLEERETAWRRERLSGIERDCLEERETAWRRERLSGRERLRRDRSLSPTIKSEITSLNHNQVDLHISLLFLFILTETFGVKQRT